MPTTSRTHEWALVEGHCIRCGVQRTLANQYAKCVLQGRILIEMQGPTGLTRYNTRSGFEVLDAETRYEAEPVSPYELNPTVTAFELTVNARMAHGDSLDGTLYEIRSQARTAEDVIRTALRSSSDADGRTAKVPVDQLAAEIIDALRKEGLL